jgi:ABC-type transport system substrate-binding protein
MSLYRVLLVATLRTGQVSSEIGDGVFNPEGAEGWFSQSYWSSNPALPKKPEQIAREKIDQLLTAAGWVVQDYQDLSLGAALGVVVREYPLKTVDTPPFRKRGSVNCFNPENRHQRQETERFRAFSYEELMQ